MKSSRSRSLLTSSISTEGKGRSSSCGVWRRVLWTVSRETAPWPLLAPPVADLHQEDIVRLQLDQAREGATELELPDRLLVRPALGPHQVGGGARPVLPAQHRVAAQRLQVEVGVLQR